MIERIVRLWGWLLALLSVLFFWLGTGVVEPYRTIAFNLGAVIFTIGVIGIVYDWQLKKAVRDDLLEMVGIERSVSAAGLKRVCEEAEVDWRGLLTGASRFKILLTEPSSWVEREWSHVLAAAKERSVNVVLLLPNPDGSCIAELAFRANITAEHFSDKVRTALEFLEATWRQGDQAGNLTRGSTLTIAYYERPAAYPLVLADATSVIIVGAPIDSEVNEKGFSLVFSGTPADFPMRVFTGQFERVADLPAAYANEVR